ncbi:hypothetical protein RDWZM_006172 [Blomia tropicalis]|uniref:C2H2-type domain-containing protein n=1 Tax=Blomia tropicalis TaxID=40697 RepID=A0A9Q0RNA8_BLOTA|nr:hypothetical protein RDWZM_006172 [Blomia tropicalis]
MSETILSSFTARDPNEEEIQRSYSKDFNEVSHTNYEKNLTEANETKTLRSSDNTYNSDPNETGDSEDEDIEERETNQSEKKKKSKTASKTVEKRCYCPYDGCTSSFTRPYRLKTHIDVNHSFILRFKCPEENCSREFASKAYLDKHLKRHTKPKITVKKEKKFTCNECSISFRRKNQLRVHRSELHNEPLPYICDNCSKTFPAKHLLVRHSKIHEQKNYPCPHPGCGFQIDKWSLYRKHIAECHSKIECKTCGKRFKRIENLTLHERTKHSTENVSIYVCDRPGCTKAYTRKNNLLMHQRLSHDDPKYSCQNCSKAYRHKKSLNNHLKKWCNKEPKPPIVTKVEKTLKREIRYVQSVINEKQFDKEDELAFELVDKICRKQKLVNDNECDNGPTCDNVISFQMLSQSNLI